MKGERSNKLKENTEDTVSHPVFHLSDRTDMSWSQFQQAMKRANAANDHKVSPKDKELILQRIKNAHTRPTREEINEE